MSLFRQTRPVAAVPIRRPRVVVIGAGFGGLAATRALDGADVDITLVDRRNHHVFQPLLYQVATAALSPADIAGPVRAIVCRQRNVQVILDAVCGIDRTARVVKLESGRDLPYDWLVLATGARHSYFGRDDWAVHAPGIKSIEDATAVRRKILLALERAETETDKVRRSALLTFVVIGGGPTGVELAGAIAELAHRSVSRDFRSITPHCSRVVLVHRGKRLLEPFPEALSASALRDLTKLGVEVRLDTAVTGVGCDHVMLGDETIAAHTAVWAAGVMASPAAKWLGHESDRSGRVAVDENFHPSGDARIFVIGDTASCNGANGRPLPGIAPVAKQQGAHVARAILAAETGAPPPSFRYRHYGNLATIGRSHAVIDFGRWQVEGLAAWLIWSMIHVFFLVGFRNRFSVGWGLLWNYLTYARHARLITGEIEPVPVNAAEPVVPPPAQLVPA
ncbi:NAD(P)/FAD-dependent oxidoreductase [Novosphingobium lentum]|uniref:NAD(P)/FAD-dependent oxidoreductase n=1 Tax=Novosphingobium lentum TaxID=145287 RepID=UPI000831702C|nr:NAD(P)/FAD-dependent oxidoreductase [Novosphingobium lentum]